MYTGKEGSINYKLSGSTLTGRGFLRISLGYWKYRYTRILDGRSSVIALTVSDRWRTIPRIIISYTRESIIILIQA